MWCFEHILRNFWSRNSRIETKENRTFWRQGKTLKRDLRGLKPSKEVAWVEIIGIKMIEQKALPSLKLTKKMTLKWQAFNGPNGCYSSMGNQLVTSEIR